MMPAHWSALIAAVPLSVNRSISTSSAGTINRLYPPFLQNFLALLEGGELDRLDRLDLERLDNGFHGVAEKGVERIASIMLVWRRFSMPPSIGRRLRQSRRKIGQGRFVRVSRLVILGAAKNLGCMPAQAGFFAATKTSLTLRVTRQPQRRTILTGSVSEAARLRLLSSPISPEYNRTIDAWLERWGERS